MRRIVWGIAICCLWTLPAYAFDTCGIGTAIKRLKFVEHPLSSDFDVPSHVILQESEATPPFHFCDEQQDLKPGISFMSRYVDKLISSGAAEDEPDIVTMRHAVTVMKKLSEQHQTGKKGKKKKTSPSPPIAPSPPSTNH
jgi:hypothetical protein